MTAKRVARGNLCPVPQPTPPLANVTVTLLRNRILNSAHRPPKVSAHHRQSLPPSPPSSRYVRFSFRSSGRLGLDEVHKISGIRKGWRDGWGNPTPDDALRQLGSYISQMPFVKKLKSDAYFSRFQVKYRRRREGKTDCAPYFSARFFCIS